ncbi:MAG: glycosyl hydrolase family 28 protein [Bacteroidota bacterium]
MKRALLLNFLLVSVLSVSSQTFNILDYGADDSDKKLSTTAIQKTIDACAANNGGTVLIPSGQFLTGTLQVFSDIEFHLSAGAVLLGSTDLEDYNKMHDQLIWGENLVNFSITGTGKINGQGESFFDKGELQDQNSWRALERPEPWIQFSNSQRIKIKDTQFVNSPAHVLVFDNCSEVFVDGISIRNDLRSPNTDGIDIKGGKDILISNCFIETGDDAICLKANQQSVENMVVTNCILASDDSAIKFGTGSRHRIRNCQFSNINIRDTRYGIALFMNQGGIYENCLFQNIMIETASRHVMEYPIFMDIDKRTSEFDLGKIQNISFKDIRIISRGQILIAGQKDAPIKDIDFDDVSLVLPNLADPSKVQKKPRGNRKFKKVEGMMDLSGKSANFVFGYVEGLSLNKLKTTTQFDNHPLQRETFYFEEVKQLEVSKLKGTVTREIPSSVKQGFF